MYHRFVLQKDKDIAITVGDGASDIRGFDSKAIQMALDAVNHHGGGVVKLSEGTFEILGPVRLYSNIKLEGSGEKTLLKKVQGFRTEFTADADYGELVAKIKDTSGFKTGMGIRVTDYNNNSAWNASTAVITKIEDDNIHFDNYLVRDYSSQQGGIVSNACSIIEGVNVSNCAISNLVVDGSAETNDFIDGCRGGGIYLHKAQNCLVENVAVKNFSGDGISWQVTNDITIKNCTASECTNFGMHPGTGSGASLVEGCSIHHNGTDGLFICWRVQHGLFKNNKIYKNGRSGISIGHKDTNNYFEGNDIYENGYAGIYVRPEIESNGAHFNTYINNTIRDNGTSEEGFGVLFHGEVKGTIIKDNIISDSGNNIQKTGICLKGNADDYYIADNHISAPLEHITVK